MAGPMGRGPGRGRDFSEKQKPKDRYRRFHFSNR